MCGDYDVDADQIEAWAVNIRENWDWLQKMVGWEPVQMGTSEYPEAPSNEAIIEYNQTMMNMANTVGFSGIRGTGGWFNRGDGVKMVQSLGAELWNMNNFSGNRIAIKIVDPKLKKSKVEVGACTGCHDSTALELPAAADLADSRGNKADPHALPDGEGHSSITCVSCHKLHDAEEKVEETAYDLCYGCHHDEVFECGTCH